MYAIRSYYEVWVSDITYIRTLKGFCYLALITDAYSRKIVGYDLSDSLELSGCVRALNKALYQAKDIDGLIHHSDRGIQYCSNVYTQIRITSYNVCYTKLLRVEGKSLNFNTIKIASTFVKWVMYIVLLVMVSDILNLTMISEQISNLLEYLPQLLTAFIIFTVGLILASTLKKGIRTFFDSADLSGGKIISQIVFFLMLTFISYNFV